jgi:serine/threonine-protein kinase
MQVVYSVLSTPPALPAGVSPELGRIVRRAMALAPSARFASADEVRRGVEGFVRHRGSEELTRETLVRLDAFLAKLTEIDGERGEDVEEQETLVHNLFGECRFGFQQALREWPENERAAEGLVRAVEAMAEHELAMGDGRAAMLLLSQVDAPSPQLLARAEEARRAEEAERERVARIDRDLDASIGIRTRRFLSLIFTAVWTVSPLAQLHFWPETMETNLDVARNVGVIWVGVAVLAVWARDSMSKTLLNRRIVVFALSAVGACGLCHVGAHIAGMTVAQAFAMDILLFAFGATVGMFTVDRRFVFAAIGYVIAFVVAAGWPEYAVHAMSGGNAVMLGVAIRGNRQSAGNRAYWSSPRP